VIYFLIALAVVVIAFFAYSWAVCWWITKDDPE
jgi:hypothetical protein